MLLKQFGSLENIKNTPDEEILKLKGITKEIIEKIKNNN